MYMQVNSYIFCDTDLCRNHEAVFSGFPIFFLFLGVELYKAIFISIFIRTVYLSYNQRNSMPQFYLETGTSRKTYHH